MLAQESGSCVLISHHVRKETAKKGERSSIKGVSALVNGLRSASIMWEPEKPDAEAICKKIHEPYEAEKIVKFKSVKGNFVRDKKAVTLKRCSNGRLIAIDDELRDAKNYTDEELQEILIQAIAEKAKAFQPYQLTDKTNGLFARKETLPEPLNCLTRNRLQTVGEQLLESGRIKKAAKQGCSRMVWLDVPDGPVAKGEFANVTPGADRSSANEENGDDPDGISEVSEPWSSLLESSEKGD